MDFKKTFYFKKIKDLITLGHPEDAVLRGSGKRSNVFKDIDFEQKWKDRKTFYYSLIEGLSKIEKEELIKFVEFKINNVKYFSVEDILDKAEEIIKAIIEVNNCKLDLIAHFPFGKIPKGYNRDYIEVTNVFILDKELDLEAIKEKSEDKFEDLLKSRDYYGLIKFFRMMAILNNDQKNIDIIESELDKLKELSLKLDLTPYDVMLKKELQKKSISILKDLHKIIVNKA